MTNTLAYWSVAIITGAKSLIVFALPMKLNWQVSTSDFLLHFHLIPPKGRHHLRKSYKRKCNASASVFKKPLTVRSSMIHKGDRFQTWCQKCKTHCYITLGWKCLSETNVVAYWAHFQVTKKIQCFEYDTRESTHNTSLSSLHTYGLNNIGCKGLPGTIGNALAYWTHW